MTNDGTGQGTTDATRALDLETNFNSVSDADSPTTDIPRELPQSFGVVAHIWSRQR
jgi:hypothetical protein